MKQSVRNAKYPRRHRPGYPTLSPGANVLIERVECGVNIEHKSATLARMAKYGGEWSPRLLRNCFVFERAVPATGRSKYQPHRGEKQQARDLSNAVRRALT